MNNQPDHQLLIHNNDCNFEPGNDYVVRQEEKYQDQAYTIKKNKRSKIKHYLCCICCPCLPMWARYSCCAILLLFFIFLIIVGVLVAIFKVPSIDFNGPTKHPDRLAPFEKSNDTLAFSVNFGLKIAVINDNLESITFESIRTVAYYPTAPHTPVGGGEIHNLVIKAYGISNFTFPFSIKYDPMKDEGYAMLIDIATKCGLLGGSAKEDLLIEYDIIPIVRIAGIAISPVIHQSSHFPCPISEGQLNMGINSNIVEEDDDEEEEE